MIISRGLVPAKAKMPENRRCNNKQEVCWGTSNKQGSPIYPLCDVNCEPNCQQIHDSMRAMHANKTLTPEQRTELQQKMQAACDQAKCSPCVPTKQIVSRNQDQDEETFDWKGEEQYPAAQDNVASIYQFGKPHINLTDFDEDKVVHWVTSQTLLKLRDKYPRLNVAMVADGDKFGTPTLGMGVAWQYFANATNRDYEYVWTFHASDQFDAQLFYYDFDKKMLEHKLTLTYRFSRTIQEFMKEEPVKREIMKEESPGKPEEIKQLNLPNNVEVEAFNQRKRHALLHVNPENQPTDLQALGYVGRFSDIVTNDSQGFKALLGINNNDRPAKFFAFVTSAARNQWYSKESKVLEEDKANFQALNESLKKRGATLVGDSVFIPTQLEAILTCVGAQAMYEQLMTKDPDYDIPFAAIGITHSNVFVGMGNSAKTAAFFAEDVGFQDPIRFMLYADRLPDKLLNNEKFEQLYNTAVRNGVRPTIALTEECLNVREFIMMDLKRTAAYRKLHPLPFKYYASIAEAERSKRNFPKNALIMISGDTWCDVCSEEREIFENMTKSITKIVVNVEKSSSGWMFDTGNSIIKFKKVPLYICKTGSDYTKFQDLEEVQQCGISS